MTPHRKLTDTRVMAQPDTIVLSNGGIRSFVASAIAAREYGARHTAILHLRSNDPGAEARIGRIRKQAESLQMSHVVTLDQPELRTNHHLRGGGEPEAKTALSRSRLLLTAMAEAIELGITRLIWPVQVDEDFDQAAKITEQTVLAQHLAELENDHVPSVDMPLLDLSDHQVVELGNQMDVPWELTWSCLTEHSSACWACQGCRRRRAAFESAQTDDPIDQLQTQR